MSLRLRVLCVGDSLVMGAWDTAGGWVDRLKQQWNTQYVNSDGLDRVQVYNLGIGSETTTTLLKRLESEIQARTSKEWPLIVIVGIGKNDSRVVEGSSLTTLAEYRSNIQKIAEIAQRYSSKLFFIEPLPVRGEEVEFKNTYYRSSVIAQYADALQDQTDSLGVPMVRLREKFHKISHEIPCYAVDGIHLNDAGHEFIFREVSQKLDELIR